ncbi:MAG TPA: formate/nitrite transporter family protein [Erysipelotrichaceae bacterium]|nr:formate/nitrite transporter family protein [Erysipelotrichaceae bacterium]
MKSLLKMLLSGIYAGLAIGLGSFGYILTRYLTNNTLLASCIFSIGLTIVCLSRFNLYTGKVGVFLDKRGKVIENLINLPIMLIGNTVGAFALGILCHFIFLNVADFQQLAVDVSIGKTSSTMVVAEGIFCGALVYVAVYAFNNFQNLAMKILGIITPITLVVYSGFQHCIANMFYFGMAFNWNIDMLWNILIVILTNSVGALIVSGLVHLSAIVSGQK